MRRLAGGIGLCVLLLATGCTNSKWSLLRSTSTQPVAGETPTVAALVEHLNRNARQIQSLDCRELDLDCKRGQSIGLQGWLVCQKPKNFRLGAKLVGSQAVDIGSNDHEFWWWISKAEPPNLYHCSYEDFARGGAQRMPFPFQPEWVMEALGMAEYDPAKNYRVDTHGTTLDLVEEAVSPQGQRTRKITVINRNNNFKVQAYILQDAQGKEICSAQISEFQQVGGTVVVPRRLRLVWPAEQIELRMKLDEVTVNQPLDADRVARLFRRQALPNVQSVDLVRGPDASPGPLQPAGGVLR